MHLTSARRSGPQTSFLLAVLCPLSAFFAGRTDRPSGLGTRRIRVLGTLVVALAVLAGIRAEPTRAQSPLTEVETKDGTTVLSVFDDGVIEAPASGGGFLLPDGTLIDESSDLGSISLPFSATSSSSLPLLDLTQTGSGRAGHFAIDSTGSFIEALLATTNGGGDAIKGLQTGTGGAGLFQILNESSGASVLSATTNGTGRAGDFSITDVENSSPALFAETVGRGYAGLFRVSNSEGGIGVLRAETNGSVGHAGVFEIDSSDNDSSAVQGTTNGTGPAVEGVHRGERGHAGDFANVNGSNSEAALVAETAGFGPALIGETFGVNHSAVFEIENTDNDSSAVQGITNGTGPAVEGVNRGERGHGGDFAIVNGSNGEAALVAETVGGGLAAEMSAFKSATVRDNPAGNVVLMRNSSAQSGPDVLGLQAGPSNPDLGVNYVSFYDGSGTSVGAIEGNGSGGVQYKTSGADYAEALPVARDVATPEAADLVGVRAGKVGLETEDADRLMVVTGRAAVLGNAYQEAETDDTRRVPVAFVGQVPVRVRGPALPGDWIVASGRDDGTAKAVAPADYHPDQHGAIAGQAWSRKTTAGIDEVTVAVGLGHATVLAGQLQQQRSQIDSLRNRMQALEETNERQERITKQVAALQDRPSTVPRAGWSRALLLVLLVGLGGFGAGVLWRRRT